MFVPGSCHFPQYGEEYFKQLTAEKRVIRLHKGFPKASWETLKINAVSVSRPLIATTVLGCEALAPAPPQTA
jgi:hypothetical protein